METPPKTVDSLYIEVTKNLEIEINQLKNLLGILILLLLGVILAGFLFHISSIMALVIMPLAIFMHGFDINSLVLFCVFLISSSVYLIPMFLIMRPLYRKIHLLTQFQKIQIISKNSFHTRETIDQCLVLLESIERLMIIGSLRIKIGKHARKNDPLMIKINDDQLHYLTLLMQDLRNDLKSNIVEKVEILMQAKSEVSANIQGTPELLAVSEAQKIGLDRQIEQFEELQRVLVRM